MKVYFLYYTFLNLFLVIFSEKKLLKLNIIFYFKIIFIKSNINFYYEKILFERESIYFNLLLILYVFEIVYLENFEEILNHVDKVQDRIINLISSIITIIFIKNTNEFNDTKYNYYKLSRLKI